MATAAPGRKILGRVDYSDVRRASPTGTRADEPVPRARVRQTTVIATAGPPKARMNGPARVNAATIEAGPNRENKLARSTSSGALSAKASFGELRPKRTRSKSSDPESPNNALFWEVQSPRDVPPVPPIPSAHQSIKAKAFGTPSDTPRSASLVRKASSPMLARPSSPDGRAQRSVPGAQQTPSPGFVHASSPRSSPNTSVVSVSPAPPSQVIPLSPRRPSIVPYTQPANVHATARHQRSKSSSAASLVSAPMTFVSGASSEVWEQEKEAWLAAKREEDEEKEARIKRKIMDLEITNASLLAINNTLERNKLKQTAELRDLRHTLQSGLPLASPLLPSLASAERNNAPTSEAGLTETDWETLLAEDPVYAGIIQSVEDLVKQAQRACAYVAELPKEGPRVLQPQFLEPPDVDLGTSSEEEDVSIDVPMRSPVVPSTKELRDIGVQTVVP